MSAFWILTRRELGGYFGSLTGYVVMSAVLFLMGLGFTNLLSALSETPSDAPLTELFYRTWYFWLIILVVTPGVTMRSFAHEKASGTWECLMTAPVGDTQVVMAKFAGSLIFYMIMWIPLLGCLFVVRAHAGDAAALSAGGLLSAYLGFLLVGGLYVSMGCFASALTKNQTIAAITAFILGIGFFFLGYFSYTGQLADSPFAALAPQISMIDHMEEFVTGVVDSRRLVFYGSLTALFLFLTNKAVESRSWR